MKLKHSLFIFYVLAAFHCIGQTLIPYYGGGKYGYCDMEGTIKIAPQYDKVDFFSSDSLATVIKGNNKILINKKGYELLTFPLFTYFTVLPVYQHLEKTTFQHRPQVGDTIKHLRWVRFNGSEYQLLNLKANTASAIYHFATSKVDYLNAYRPPLAIGFTYGYHIGKLAENSYDVFNSEGAILYHAQTMPKIWNQESVTFEIDGGQCLFNPVTGKTIKYPYQSIAAVVENKYLIVSTAKDTRNSLLPSENDARYGIIRIDGQVILDTLYQQIEYHNGSYILKKDNHSFLTNLKNILVDTGEFKSIYPLNDSLLLAQRHDDKVKVLSSTGRAIFGDQTFDEFKFLKHENYYTARRGIIASIFDSRLNAEVSCVAESIFRAYGRSDRYIVSSNRLTGMINSKGEIVIPIQYDGCSHRTAHFIILTKDGKMGVANSNGKIILEVAYEDIQIEEVKGQTFIRAKKNGFYASFDVTGKQLSDFTSSSASVSGRPVDWHHHDDGYHFTDFHGSPLNVDSKHFVTGYTEKDSLFIAVLYGRDTIKEVIIDGKLFIDWSRAQLRPKKIDIKAGLIAVSKGNEQGVINIQGETILPFSKQEVVEINNHFFIVNRQGLYYIFDRSGKQINSTGYDYVSDSPIKGRRAVAINIKNQFYKYIVDPCISDRQDTILRLRQKFGYIDKFGAILIPLEYGATFRYCDDYVWLSKGNTEGEKESFLFDTLGKVVLQIKADRLYPLNHTDDSGYYIAEINGKVGLIDRKGKIAIPFQYSAIMGFFSDEIVHAQDFNNVWHLRSIDNKHIFTGNDRNNQSSEQCHRVAKDKILYFPNGKAEVIDRTGKVFLKIDSQKCKFVTRDDLNLIEVDMGSYVYYVNQETLIAYKGRLD